ncbi:M1 family metallopeptidase [Sphingobacterium sp. SYP-B4668]|uniref:M1 family metallopeptidase n=1 Tax=Sphingobacterium sp. SYP-B4668 TaxID=2996035 RepID=UPI0022DE2055|nr:M1 family metallopeptidase [Sphingobacterium sp. SYP-B4668]
MMKSSYKMRYILLLLLLVLTVSCFGQFLNQTTTFTKADSLRGQLSPLRTCYDVTYYHLDVAVDLHGKSITGSNLFTFKAVKNFQVLQFDLFDNLKIEKILYRGIEIPYTREFNAVYPKFPNMILAGSIDSFQVFYSGIPIAAKKAPWDGGFDWKKDQNGKAWVATACQGLGASSWWPNKDHLSDEVDSMLISVTVPEPLMNISNGRLKSIEKPQAGYRKFNWFVSNPINNYNVALNIGDYVHFNDSYQGENGPLDIDYYVIRGHESIAKKHFGANVKPMLEAFEHWFGPYPFYEDSFKLIETPHLGMEHQSGIAYGNQYKNGYLGHDGSGTGWGLKWDFIIIHEAGHEWFGNNITAGDIADLWIHESFTNYSEALYIDYHFGKKAGQEYVHGNRKGIQNDIPLQGPYHVNKEGSGDMYVKGGVLHNMIRTIINDDDKWRSILRGLNKDFFHQTVDYQDIVSYLSRHSGIDMSTIFEQYVQHTDIPTLEVKWGKDGLPQARWISDVRDFKMPIAIGIKGKERQQIQLTTVFKPLEILGLSKANIDIDTFNYYIKVSM